MKRLSKWLDAALWLFAPIALVLLMEGFARGSFAQALGWALDAPLLFAAAWGMAAGLCFAFCIFGSLRLRCILTLLAGWLVSLVGIASRYKMRYRLEPALFGDVYQLGDAWAAVRTLPFEINPWEIAWVCAAFLLLLAGCCFLRAKRKRRLVLPAIGLALLMALPGACTFERSSGRTHYDLADHARSDGVLYTALAVENQRRALMRMDYNETDVRSAYRALMANVQPAQAEDAPNIILVLSESFTSHEWLRQHLALTREITPYFDQLAASCQSGWLRVPKAGGGTSETEFEVLTGLRSQYATNPYALGLPPMNSLASILRGKGYHASAIHWYTGVYYNRYHNLQNLGFDEFATTDTTSRAFETYGMFVSDREHYASVLEQLERTQERDFIFLLTMQNHGGYDYADFQKTLDADVPFSNAVSDRAEQILANYLCLLTESDRALEGFIRELETFAEPTLVVFFGDHIPPFGDDVYAELGLSSSDAQSFLAPYFIWSNVQNQPARLDMNAYELGAQALGRAGLLDDPFLSHVENLRQAGAAPDETYALLSYDALFGAQYAYAEGGLSPRNEAFQIGGEMVLSGFDAVQIADAIYLRPQLSRPGQRFKLSINGQLTDVPAVPADAGALTLQCVMTSYNALPYNQSNALEYTDAQTLLASSGELPVRRVSGLAWDIHETRGSLTLYRSAAPMPDCCFAVLTAGGDRLSWQPMYGLTRTRQYALGEDDHLYVALSADDASLLQRLTAHLLGE